MTINTSVSDDGSELVIEIVDRFDFSLHQSFKDAYVNREEEIKTFILDLSGTSYMDSSALGMILLLKDYSEGLKAEIIIRKPSENVNKVLEIAQFNRLLTIEH